MASPASEPTDSAIQGYMEEVIKTFENPGMFNVGTVRQDGSPTIQEHSIWRTYSTFDSATGERRSANTILNMERENLVLRANTEVTEILYDGDYGVPFARNDEVPRARCVRLESQSFFIPEEILCVRDGGRIYVAAGAILSPILLLKSGIGPGREVVDNPQV